MQIYWNEKQRLHKKKVQLPGPLWDTNMAAVLLFHNMADLKSSQKVLYVMFLNVPGGHQIYLNVKVRKKLQGSGIPCPTFVTVSF